MHASSADIEMVLKAFSCAPVSVGTVLIDNIIFTCYTEIISCMVGDSMSRQPRVAGEYLHIIVRGIGKQLLFEDTSDNEKYLFFLKKYAAECRITLLAYCLMENHVHLLLRDSDSAISVFMKKIGVCYAQYFNRKYNRTKRDTALVILKSSGLSIRQIERLTGINRGVIQKAKSCQPEPSP